MTRLPIPDDLAGAYKGSGHALAAIDDGVVREFLYFRDLLPDFDAALIDLAIKDFRLAQLGDVTVGMVSDWEFTGA